MAAADEPTAPGAPTPTKVGTRIGRYDVGEEIGAGGIGVVYRARDPELKRDVAIKVVSAQARSAERLLVEARAMARLDHPALMPVFDVGATEDGLFIVMPLVTGGTLHDWTHAERRHWKDVTARFIAAGRGLEAAHAAGLIHRDFKPKNVLLDGEDVMVTDFGLAADEHELLESAEGTLAYVAPEQAAGRTSDARADQYAFAIAFWGGLHGERPQEAETRTSSAPPRRSRLSGRQGVPPRLSAALERGYRADPAERWPSMTALLDHIDRRRRLRKRAAIAAVAVGVIGAAVVATLALRSGSEDLCQPPTSRLTGVWTPVIQARLDASMRATDLPYASDSAQRVRPIIDAYVHDWQAMHIATCRATHVARTQPASMLDRRMHCLDRRLAALTSHMRALLESDPVAVQKSVATMLALPPIQHCADEKALDQIQPRPSEPERLAEIERTELEITELQAFGIRGSPVEFLRRAHALVAGTRLQDYVPLHVEALGMLADAQRLNDLPPELTLRELAAVAARGGDDRSASLAWSSLVKTLALTQRFDEARQLVPAATTALARSGASSDLVFELRLATGTLACEVGDTAACVRDLEEAVTIAPTPSRRLNALHNLLAGYFNPGRYAEARRVVDEYLALAESIVGMQHPIYADALEALTFLLMVTGEPDDLVRAREVVQQIVEIRFAAFGEHHPDFARALIQSARLAANRDDLDDAESHARRALAIGEGLNAPAVQLEALRIVAPVYGKQGRQNEARSSYERALSVARTLFGPDSWDLGQTLASYAVSLQEAGDCESAIPVALEAIRILEPLGDDYVNAPLTAVGQCYLELGQLNLGFSHLERALTICAGPGSCSTGHYESVQSNLGEWLVKTGRDRKRGAALLRNARTTFERMGRSKDVAAIDGLLARHGLSDR